MSFIATEIASVYNQEIKHAILKEKEITLYMKREDLLHTEVSGNKFRKLKYNLEVAKLQKKSSVLTFGGAYSNHIAATAAAGKLLNIATIGVIRGDELGRDLEKTLKGNATLRFAKSCGMRFHFITRLAYREKENPLFLEELKQKYGDFYLVPEGGTNSLAIKGCEEILDSNDHKFDIITSAVGTGGTISGIINSSDKKEQTILGFPALKGDFLIDEIKNYTNQNNWKLITEYHFGGYSKINKELIEFINTFKRLQGIQLDPVYTGKMMYGLFEMIKNGSFRKNTRILAIHTGGIQGIAGMNNKLSKKNFPLIEV